MQAVLCFHAIADNYYISISQISMLKMTAFPCSKFYARCKSQVRRGELMGLRVASPQKSLLLKVLNLFGTKAVRRIHSRRYIYLGNHDVCLSNMQMPRE